jgi:4-amino-4-deoxy-L-arabinose transferase-like glycosyltransferase
LESRQFDVGILEALMSAPAADANLRVIGSPSPSRAGSFERPSATLLVFLVILVWTSFVSLPTFAFDDADDGFFVEVANLWTRGMAPFVASFDVKGVGFFAILAIAEKVFGPSLAALKLVGGLFSAIGATVLYRMCERYDRPAAVLCAALYPILIIISGDAAYQVMNAFLMIAFACAFSNLQLRPKAIVAGLAVGFACTIKQTCAVDAIALLYILVSARSSRVERAYVTGSFIGAAALAPFAFFSYYALNGNAGVFVQDLVIAALNRESTVALSSVLGGFVEWIWPFSIIVVVLLISISNGGRAIENRLPLRLMLVWLVLELIGIFAQRAGSRPYMVPMIAPMLLITSNYISASYAGNGRSRQLVALVMFGALAFIGAMAGYGHTILEKLRVVDQDALQQTTAAIAATHPRNDDRLFVLNGPVWPNVATNLAPPTPFFYWGHIMCNFPGAGPTALVANFEAKPRYVVFENPNRRLACETDATDDEIRTALAARYSLISTARSRYSIYSVFELSH